MVWLVFFFFQAEDGIRVRNVTGVQTCALPICRHRPASGGRRPYLTPAAFMKAAATRCWPVPTPAVATEIEPGFALVAATMRSEERRVGKGRGARWGRATCKQRRARSDPTSPRD